MEEWQIPIVHLGSLVASRVMETQNYICSPQSKLIMLNVIQGMLGFLVGLTFVLFGDTHPVMRTV